MLMKGCPVQACSSNKPGAGHPALAPLGADPPGLFLGSTPGLSLITLRRTFAKSHCSTALATVSAAVAC